MNSFPKIIDVSSGWQTFFIMTAVVTLPPITILFCALFFKHKHRRRLHRRRHHDHGNYPANPTLAQTGGLPPVRETDNPPDQPQP
jgi:hypothetical protein